MFKKLTKKINYLIKLGRYNNPEGALLLMWPCFWGALANFQNTLILIESLFLFSLGSLVMRGAGCCINDIFDRKIDKLVKRTKQRPLAQKKLNIIEVLIFTVLQLLLGLLIIVQFDLKIIIMGFLVIPFVIIYPLIKRFSYYPQFVLGFIFNWGVFIGYLSSNQIIDEKIMLLYFAGVFLTISYDTIYGFQDIEDDKKIGVKSFSILIEKKAVFFIALTYFISFFLFCLFFFLFYENLIFNIVSCLLIFSFLLIQVIEFIKKKSLLKIFKSNVIYGGIISVIIYIGNYL